MTEERRFQVGDKVRCIDRTGIYVLVVGEVYTVSRVIGKAEGWFHEDFRVGLEEIRGYTPYENRFEKHREILFSERM